MIIGKGLLAKSLSGTNHNDHLLFCSGVSDSQEGNQAAFERERNLIQAQDSNIPLFYFSTISIFNPAKASNAYILHKIEMESLVLRTFPSSLIVRLPNMVGPGGNPSNLFPYFLHAIAKNKPVSIHSNTRRFILGAEDLPKIVSAFMKSNLRGEINVCFSEPAPVLEMYLLMCSLMGKEPRFSEDQTEPAHHVQNDRFLAFLADSGITLEMDWKAVVEKYTLESLHSGQIR